jgi:hypothetical protein
VTRQMRDLPETHNKHQNRANTPITQRE